MFKQISRTTNLNTQFKMRSSTAQINKISNQSSKPFFMNLTKKYFSSGNSPYSLLPVTRSIVLGNLVMWGVSWFFNPQDYITNFYYSSDSLQKGKVHTAITSHFVKPKAFDVLLDTAVIGLLGNPIESKIGTALTARLLVFSALGSIAIVHATARSDEYFGMDTFIRGLIYFLTIRNPQYSIKLRMLPFRIRLAYLAIAVAVVDVSNGKIYNFGPMLASFALARKKAI